jgi:hypothetical protein
VITFHEIRRVIQKMAVLSGHIVQLNRLLPEVIQLSEKIDSLNEDLTLERDRMTAKIRSVEVLGEILRTHVYQNPTGVGREQTIGQFDAAQGQGNEESPKQQGQASDPGDDGRASASSDQSFFHPKLDGSSMML